MYESKSSASCAVRTYESIQKEISEECGRRGIQGFPARLERFGRGHARALEMATYCESNHAQDGGRKRAKKLRQCGDHLAFRHYYTLDQIKLAEAHFCQQFKLCPLCAVRRGAKMLGRYIERVCYTLAERPGLRAYLVTSTVKNGPDLGERVAHLNASLDQLHARRRRWRDAEKHHRRKAQPWTEAARAIGSVGSIEVKRGDGSGQWHPHFHDAWLCEDEPDQDKLRAEWREITGDSHIIDVRPFHYVQRGEPATADNLGRDFSEVFKYALKFQGLPLPDNWHAAQELHGRRLIRSYGALFGVKVPDDLTDDPLTDKDLPYVQWFYRYVAGRGYQLEHVEDDSPARFSA